MKSSNRDGSRLKYHNDCRVKKGILWSSGIIQSSFSKISKKILKKLKKLAFNLISWIIYIIKKIKHSSSDVALSNHSIFQQILTLDSHYATWKMFFNIGIQLFFIWNIPKTFNLNGFFFQFSVLTFPLKHQTFWWFFDEFWGDYQETLGRNVLTL